MYLSFLKTNMGSTPYPSKLNLRLIYFSERRLREFRKIVGNRLSIPPPPPKKTKAGKAHSTNTPPISRQMYTCCDFSEFPRAKKLSWGAGKHSNRPQKAPDRARIAAFRPLSFRRRAYRSISFVDLARILQSISTVTLGRHLHNIAWAGKRLMCEIAPTNPQVSSLRGRFLA